MPLFISFEVNEDVRLENLRVALSYEAMLNQIAMNREAHAAAGDREEDWPGYWIELTDEYAVRDGGAIIADDGWGFGILRDGGSDRQKVEFIAPDAFATDGYILEYWEDGRWLRHPIEWVLADATYRLADSWSAHDRPCRVWHQDEIVHRAYPEGFTDEGYRSEPEG
jgi:hypothetical protein